MLRYLIVLLFLLLPFNVYAATITATSCEEADIATAIATASNGDTIMIPSGNCTWTSTITVDKEVALIGAGIGVTNITVAHADGHFTISDGINNWRIAHISFSTSTSSQYAIYVCTASAQSSSDWRIDHCEFTGFHYSILVRGDNQGVIDNNNFKGGGITIYGNDSPDWSNTTDLGTINFVFIEDNTFTDTGSLSVGTHVCMGGHAARYVFRYNTITMEKTGAPCGFSGAVDAHGYCHGVSCRGTRAYEIYENTFITHACSNPSRGLYLRAGTGVVYNNTFDTSAQAYIVGEINLTEERCPKVGGWSGTGQTACSANCSTTAFCLPEYYTLDYDGEVNNFTSAVTVEGSTSGAMGQIFVVDDNGVDGTLYFHNIIGTFLDDEDLEVSGVTYAIANGSQSAKITGEGYPCCDQVGRGNAQASEPIYFWGNKDHNSSAVTPVLSSAVNTDYITDSTDYYSNTQKSGYTAYTYPHPLRAGESIGMHGCSVTGGSFP